MKQRSKRQPIISDSQRNKARHLRALRGGSYPHRATLEKRCMGRGVVERRHTDERVSEFSMQVLEGWILCSLSCERGEEDEWAEV